MFVQRPPVVHGTWILRLLYFSIKILWQKSEEWNKSLNPCKDVYITNDQKALLRCHIIQVTLGDHTLLAILGGHIWQVPLVGHILQVSFIGHNYWFIESFWYKGKTKKNRKKRLFRTALQKSFSLKFIDMWMRQIISFDSGAISGKKIFSQWWKSALSNTLTNKSKQRMIHTTLIIWWQYLCPCTSNETSKKREPIICQIHVNINPGALRSILSNRCYNCQEKHVDRLCFPFKYKPQTLSVIINCL